MMIIHIFRDWQNLAVGEFGSTCVTKRYNDYSASNLSLNGRYRLPRTSCGNGQYTPPTSNSLSRSLTPVGYTPCPYDRPNRSTRTRYWSS